jgi:two-component system chemotaxis response regulator CheB
VLKLVIDQPLGASPRFFFAEPGASARRLIDVIQHEWRRAHSLKALTLANIPIEVLVVDDSAIVRGLLTRALESDPGIKIVGSAMHGEAALRFLRDKSANVVLLDVEMPVMGGLEALEKIQALHPDVHVIMVSSLTISGAEISLKAMRLGAVGCIAKPEARNASEAVEVVAKDLVPLVLSLKKRPTGSSTVAPVTPRSMPATVAPMPPSRPRFGQATELLVVGSSTGGPRALEVFVKGLPHDFDLPICVVQHMPAFFTPMLAKHLGDDSGRPTCEAKPNMVIQPGHIYVAPGDYHFTVARRDRKLVAQLNQDPPEHFCRPSVNPLFRSAAACCGGGLIAAMFTGMGEDGLEGTGDIHRAGGHVIAQDEATSVVWGMPGAITRAGFVHQVLPLNDIASAVGRAVRRTPQGALR